MNAELDQESQTLLYFMICNITFNPRLLNNKIVREAVHKEFKNEGYEKLYDELISKINQTKDSTVIPFIIAGIASRCGDMFAVKIESKKEYNTAALPFKQKTAEPLENLETLLQQMKGKE